MLQALQLFIAQEPPQRALALLQLPQQTLALLQLLQQAPGHRGSTADTPKATVATPTQSTHH